MPEQKKVKRLSEDDTQAVYKHLTRLFNYVNNLENHPSKVVGYTMITVEELLETYFTEK